MAAFRTSQWRWLSGFLGILCLSLMTLIGILLNKSIFNESIKPTILPGPTEELQEGYSDCCFCQEGWIGYQRNCYFFSTEPKSWEASRKICESKNSSLLQMDSKHELDFIRRRRYFYWTGVSYNTDRSAWLWLNGSAVSLHLFEELQDFNTRNCILYKPNEGFWDESCVTPNSYICKQKLN